MNISLYYAVRQYEMNEFQRKMAKKEELVGEVGGGEIWVFELDFSHRPKY